MCFQFDRDCKVWEWPENKSTVDTSIKLSGVPGKLIEDKREVIIRISLSVPISKSATLDVVAGTPVEINLLISDPDVTWLKSRNQLQALAQKFRDVLKAIEKRIPNCSRIHLFYAGPTGGAITIGQQINPRMNPPVELYEYCRQSIPHHRRVLTLSS